jgi:hypothetical protein
MVVTVSSVARAFIVVALLSVLVAPIAHADNDRFVDYLFMEPNEGGSSAGHVALAFDDHTYTFQRSPEGRLILERDETDHVRYLYTVLGNRPLQRSRVAVSPATFERLREGFNRRYLIQQSQLALLDGLVAEQRLLALLVARRSDPPDVSAGLAIEAVGYFLPVASRRRSLPLIALRTTVATAYGPGFIDQRIIELRARLATTTPDERDLAPPALTADEYPVGGALFAARYTAVLSGIVALAVLSGAPELDPDGLVTVGDDGLTDAEERALGRYAESLRRGLVRLVASERGDFGFPLLVGMARLAAVERSLAEHRLVVLDAFPPHGRRLTYDALTRAPDAARGLLDDARDDFAASRRGFATTNDPSERDYVGLETAANRFVELRRGVTEGRDVRLGADPLVPSRPALRTDLVVPDLPLARLTAAERAANAAARAYADAFDDLYRYDLVRRNCVTEMFRTVDAVLGPDADAALGGRIPPGGGRHFIPSLATRAIRRTWRIVSSDTTPSYRQARVAALARSGNPLVVRLRESNTLTSTIYRRSRDDSTFLFFTDDAPLLRPLLGAANLTVGLGASLLGIAEAPLDRGEALQAGLRGVLWSLPELVFVNVRKGSFDHVARHDRPDAPPWHESPPPSPR